MEIKIEVPEYNSEKGITYKWMDGFDLETKFENGLISIIGNKEGLISLANHFLNLAQDNIPSGHHLHFDEYNSLNEGSIELVIQKK